LRNSYWNVNGALTGAYYLCLKRKARSSCSPWAILQLFTIRSRLLLRGNVKEYGTIIVSVFCGMKVRVSQYVMSITRDVQEWGAEENDGPKKKTVSGG